MVVPHEGTWIEISNRTVRALTYLVVPHEGTWIEILPLGKNRPRMAVVPHEGTWIEMQTHIWTDESERSSFPTRERGLKFLDEMKMTGGPLSFPTRERGLKLSIIRR